MRLVIDTLVGLMLVGILAGVIAFNRQDQSRSAERELARTEVRRFQQQIHLQMALSPTQDQASHYPKLIDPEWFGNSLPRNPYLENGHPWVEIARDTDRDLLHPRERVATSEESAAFWYNPFAGVVRARVPQNISDANGLDLYNYLNDCSLSGLFKDP